MRACVLIGLALLASCGSSAPATEPPSARAGLTIERVMIAGAAITIVRVDLERYRPVLVTAASHDGRFRTMPEWARQAGLVAAINASLFEPDGRPTSLLVQDGLERSPDDQRFGGFFAFDPIDPSATPAFTFGGRGCDGVSLEALRARYRNVVANYRMLDCDGLPIAWADERAYAIAAFGLDREGSLVLVHSREARRVTDLARVLAEPRFGLVHLHYVEGGPKATLFADDGRSAPTVEVGRRAEDSGDRDRRPRPIPNVLGVVPRAPERTDP